MALVERLGQDATDRALAEVSRSRQEFSASLQVFQDAMLRSGKEAHIHQLNLVDQKQRALQDSFVQHHQALTELFERLGGFVEYQLDEQKKLVITVSIVSCVVTAGIGALVAWLALR